MQTNVRPPMNWLLSLVVACAAWIGSASSIRWADGDGHSGTINSAGWNDIQTAITNAACNEATPGSVKLSGDFARTPGDASVGSLTITNSNLSLSGGWDSGFTVQSGKSVLDVNGSYANSNDMFRVLSIFTPGGSAGVTNVAVSGCVVTNGNPENYYSSGLTWRSAPGAGVYISGCSDVRLQNLVVTRNTTSGGYGAGNGAIYVGQSDGVRISDCLVLSNVIMGAGGGIAVDQGGTAAKPVIIERCTIAGNTVTDNGQNYRFGFGGGVNFYTGITTPYFLVMSDCQVLNNHARCGSGIFVGCYHPGSRFTAFGCLIATNYHPGTVSGSSGEGIQVSNMGGVSRFINCTVVDNVSPTDPASVYGNFFGAAPYTQDRSIFVNCISTRNAAGWFVQVHGGGNDAAVVDFQDSTLWETNYFQQNDAGNPPPAQTNWTTFAAAIANTGVLPMNGFRSLTPAGAVTNDLEQNIEGSANLRGKNPAPYQLTAASANAVNNGLTKTDSRGFKYVDVDIDGVYTTNVDIIVSGAAPCGGPHLVYTTDLLGNPRYTGREIDRGAYESLLSSGGMILVR